VQATERLDGKAMQRTGEPRGERHSEPTLLPSGYRRGYRIRQCPAQHAFRLEAAELPRDRQPAGQLYQAMVHEPRAPFERGGHSGTVELREEVVGEVALEIEPQERVDLRASRGGHRLPARDERAAWRDERGEPRG